MENRSNSEPSPGNDGKSHELLDELNSLRLIRQYLCQQIRLAEHPSENGSPDELKKAFKVICGQIRQIQKELRDKK